MEFNITSNDNFVDVHITKISQSLINQLPDFITTRLAGELPIPDKNTIRAIRIVLQNKLILCEETYWRLYLASDPNAPDRLHHYCSRLLEKFIDQNVWEPNEVNAKPVGMAAFLAYYKYLEAEHQTSTRQKVCRNSAINNLFLSFQKKWAKLPQVGRQNYELIFNAFLRDSSKADRLKLLALVLLKDNSTYRWIYSSLFTRQAPQLKEFLDTLVDMAVLNNYFNEHCIDEVMFRRFINLQYKGKSKLVDEIILHYSRSVTFGKAYFGGWGSQHDMFTEQVEEIENKIQQEIRADNSDLKPYIYDSGFHRYDIQLNRWTRETAESIAREYEDPQYTPITYAKWILAELKKLPAGIEDDHLISVDKTNSETGKHAIFLILDRNYLLRLKETLENNPHIQLNPRAKKMMFTIIVRLNHHKNLHRSEQYVLTQNEILNLIEYSNFSDLKDQIILTMKLLGYLSGL
ncbi:hypothetical protein OLMES_2431 [Oleiphilus messinensis]|uniref:Uncharacterized protein n=1 Tax=Oleiphilus messinensis TaxID=141451 RepID=A0A1Y0I7L8_9GAMM|nr:hypothetical protein [Oleiphilus messinensis]ARU56492.1 hypothetical protein OLMES_2431 [Oleiphilus messinensis]